MLPSFLNRRPSAALVVALIALFVAARRARRGRAGCSLGRTSRTARCRRATSPARPSRSCARRRAARSGERALANGGVTNAKLARRRGDGRQARARARSARRSSRPGAVGTRRAAGGRGRPGADRRRGRQRRQGRRRLARLARRGAVLRPLPRRRCRPVVPAGRAGPASRSASRRSRPAPTSRATSCSSPRTPPGRSASSRSRCATRPTAAASCSPAATSTSDRRRAEVDVGFRYVVIDLPLDDRGDGAAVDRPGGAGDHRGALGAQERDDGRRSPPRWRSGRAGPWPPAPRAPPRG